MDLQKIKELALANGFKLKEQASGNMDLNAYVYDFANAVEQEAKAVPEWISVKNAMPKAGSQVLTYDDYGFVSVENIDGCEDPNNVYFSHWLPLPPVEQEPAND